jgi:hypothetical protein
MGTVMNPDHEALLKTATGTDKDSDLPEDTVKTYWEFERVLRKLGERVRTETIATIAILSGRKVQPNVEDFKDVVTRGEVKEGDRVVACLRTKWRWGWYRGVERAAGGKIEKIKVEFEDGTVENRSVDPNKVRLPYKNELKEIGEQ